MTLQYEKILSRDVIAEVSSGKVSCKEMYELLQKEQAQLRNEEPAITSEYNNLKRVIKELRLTTLGMGKDHPELNRLEEALKAKEEKYSSVYRQSVESSKCRAKVLSDITAIIEYAIERA